MKNEIKFVKGNILANLPTDRDIIIPHCLSNVGVYGAGVAGAIANMFPKAKDEYFKWYNDTVNHSIIEYDAHEELNILGLGHTQFVEVQKAPDIIIANMIGQDGLISSENPVPAKYSAISKCMESVLEYIEYNNSLNKVFDKNDKELEIYTIPFACGLAGGSYEFIKALINEIWIDNGIKVTIFDIK